MIFCKPLKSPGDLLIQERLMLDPDVICYTDDRHLTLSVLAGAGLVEEDRSRSPF